MRMLLTATLALMALSASMAQRASIRGVVTDSTTGIRLPFANVTVVGTDFGAAANELGFYMIPNLQPGEYRISVSVVGYTKITTAVTLREGETRQLDFRLPEATIEAQEVVITGRANLELLETNTSVHILTPKELKVAPVTAQADVLQSLRVLPGFVTTSDVSTRFYVRGGGGDQNLFLFDGIRVYSPFHALGIFSIFDPEMVDNVEVYTGAFPPEYGGRLSSVVSIRARDGRADRIAGLASVNLLSAKAGLEGPLFSTLTWTVNGRKSISTATYQDITGQDVPADFYDATVKVTSKPGGSQKVDFSFLASGDNMASPVPDEPDFSWNNLGFTLSGSGLMGQNIFAFGQIYASDYSARRDPKQSLVVTEASTSVKELGVRALATMYTSVDDRYNFGFEFGFPQLEYSFVNPFGLPITLKNQAPEASVWTGYEGKAGPFQYDIAFRLELGALLSGGTFSNEFQPRLSLSYLWLANWRLKAAFGRVTQRMLTIANEDEVVTVFEGWISVPEDLPPEQADHYVVGLSGALSENLSVNLEGYYKYYRSLVVYNWAKLIATDPDYVRGTGQSYGAELTLRSKVAIVDLYATYALSWATIDNQGFEYYPRYDRRHHLNLLGVAHLFRGLDFTARWEYGSGFPYSQTIGYYDALLLDDALPGPFEQETGMPYYQLGEKNAARLPAYHRLDLGMAYNFFPAGFDVTLGIDILNVYDNQNIFYVDRLTGQVVNMIAFYPSATLTVRF